MTEPETDAGRRLDARLEHDGYIDHTPDILAIEAEARAGMVMLPAPLSETFSPANYGPLVSRERVPSPYHKGESGSPYEAWHEGYANGRADALREAAERVRALPVFTLTRQLDELREEVLAILDPDH